jgi:PTH1 family peptidyl-tRNA hydrolase
MYTVVGLGNPGSEYTLTRHNTGRIITEHFAEKAGIDLKDKKKPNHRVGTGEFGGERVRIVLPDTYMNNSGKAIAPYVKSVAAAKKLIVVYDEIDLPLGSVRVSFGSSSGGHNGIKSVERAVRTRNFIKIRVGVSKAVRGKAKKPTGDKEIIDYLLKPFPKKDYDLLVGPLYERAALAVRTILETGDPIKGMNAVNGLPLL